MNTLSNLFLRNIPDIKDREFKYRTKMNSHDLNDLQTEAFKDILDLFNKANLLQKSLYEFNTANGIESVVYSKRLTQAMQKLNQVEELYNNLKATSKEYRYQTRFAYEGNTISDDYKAIINKETNNITANIVSSVSKTHVYNETYDETLIPDSIQTFIGPDTFVVGNNIFSIEDSEVNNMFDPNDANVWYRKVVTNADVEEIENEVIIALPEDIITTRLVNQIILKPFPVGYMDIMDIQYKTNGAWVSIPGFFNHQLCEEEIYTDIYANQYTRKVIKDSGNLQFDFKATQMNQLKIKLRQRHCEYDAATNHKTWYLGIRSLDVLYNQYTKDNSTFSQVFIFPETDRIVKIYDTEILYNNVNSTGHDFNVTKEYYYYDSDDNYHRITSSTPFILNGHKVLVKFYIEGNEETPNIYMTKIKYRLD